MKDAHDVQCPFCGAPKGRPCQIKVGRSVKNGRNRSKPHEARLLVALMMEDAKCAKVPSAAAILGRG